MKGPSPREGVLRATARVMITFSLVSFTAGKPITLPGSSDLRRSEVCNHNRGSKFIGTIVGEARLKKQRRDVGKKKMMMASRSTLGLGASRLLAGAIGYFLLAPKRSDAAEADSGKTTEAVAAAAGAQILPTDPKLKIEPK